MIVLQKYCGINFDINDQYYIASFITSLFFSPVVVLFSIPWYVGLRILHGRTPKEESVSIEDVEVILDRLKEDLDSGNYSRAGDYIRDRILKEIKGAAHKN